MAVVGAYAPLAVHTSIRCADASTICTALVMRAVPLQQHFDLLVAHVRDIAVVHLAAMGYGT